ncbi:DNA polymerase alpha/epsilon subunit B-domain-containing protein [Polychytrium aggregatum]|uniref:DNA polymerase alpha/epsilon subunit B-domain-containing protein n=1 Tax=Polychytrium aggregatum TaxID=110093 RepID=UPI0022FE00DB|nr:DNA polymerase alpha/epsilon subunit B-domain-containing protein [Polychytrium aggregatum]KAI9204070.1 DNA polymerase alpha/epsilon subunit B-domain-containing protein [Polychytrium aggregatum]
MTLDEGTIAKKFGLSAHSPGGRETIDRLLHYCRIYDLDADTLWTKWEAFVINGTFVDSIGEQYTPESPTIELLDRLRDTLSRDQTRKQNERMSINSSSFMSARRAEAPAGTGHPKLIMSDDLDSIISPDRLMTPKKAKITLRDHSGRATSIGSPTSQYSGSFTSPTKPIRITSPTSTSLHSPSRNLNRARSPTPTPTPLTPSTHAQRFATRTNRGQRDGAVFNDHIPFKASIPDQPVLCSITLAPNQQTDGYRFMFSKLVDQGGIINDRINDMADRIKERRLEQLSADDRENFQVSHPTQPSQEPVFIIGRICSENAAGVVTQGTLSAPDSEASQIETRFKDGGIVIEASRELGNGARVPLDFSELLKTGKGYEFFPGQIVGLEGMNVSGRKLTITQIHNPPALPATTCSLANLARMYPADKPTSKYPLNIVIASGPYTLNDSLEFEPLEDLVQAIEEQMPDVVLLLGPFVDDRHPMIENGNTDLTPDEIFASQVSTRIRRIVEAPRKGIRVVMVPSTHDAYIEWCVFPQPPLGSGVSAAEIHYRRAALDLPESVLLFPNPVQFSINEITFAISTCDILLHLSSEEVSRVARGQISDRMSRLFGHVLTQRSLYPLLPPSHNEGINYARSSELELQARPDVMILSSFLTHTQRVVDGCLCINPSLACRGQQGGTFTRLTIYPLELDSAGAGEDVFVESSVAMRARAEVIRI